MVRNNDRTLICYLLYLAYDAIHDDGARQLLRTHLWSSTNEQESDFVLPVDFVKFRIECLQEGSTPDPVILNWMYDFIRAPRSYVTQALSRIAKGTYLSIN
jgi:hypothetical protein